MQLQVEFKANPYPCIKTRKNVLLHLKRGLQDDAYSVTEAISRDFNYRSEKESLIFRDIPNDSDN